MPKVHSDGHDIDLHVYYIDLCLGSIDEDSCGEIGKRCVHVCVHVYQNGPVFLTRQMISASGQVYQADDQRVDTCCPNNLFSGVGPGTTALQRRRHCLHCSYL